MNKNIFRLKTELKFLNEIQKKKNHSQRSISEKLNIALGLANSLVKKFVNKGFLKLSEAPMRRYFYYLTPKGLTEKIKLTKDFLKSSLEFYNIVRVEYEKLLKNVQKKNPDKIFFYGISELTEIAILTAKLNNIKVDGIYDKDSRKSNFCDIEVFKKLSTKHMNQQKVFFIYTDKKALLNQNKKLNIIKPNFLLLD